MGTKALATELPRIDGDTQSRLKINDDVVSDYADLITEANGDWPFPPLDVFHDGTDYFVADGFHRLLGALRTKRGSVPCAIHKGTARDARIFGMTANDRHGLRMTRADKRACVEWLLDQPGKMTQKEVAEKAGVSVATVRNVVAERTPTSTNRGKKGNLPFNPPEVDQPPEPQGFDDGSKPPKRDGKGNSSPSTPKRGGSASEPPGFDDATEWPPQDGVDAGIMPPGPPTDYGKCPNCGSTEVDEDGDCAKCHEPEVAKVATDANGRPVPEHLREAFDTVPEFAAISRDLTGIRKRIADLAQGPGAVWLEARDAATSIKNIQHALKFGKPYAVCKCRNGCKLCRQSGYLNQNVFKRTEESE